MGGFLLLRYARSRHRPSRASFWFCHPWFVWRTGGLERGSLSEFPKSLDSWPLITKRVALRSSLRERSCNAPDLCGMDHQIDTAEGEERRASSQRGFLLLNSLLTAGNFVAGAHYFAAVRGPLSVSLTFSLSPFLGWLGWLFAHSVGRVPAHIVASLSPSLSLSLSASTHARERQRERRPAAIC